MLGQLRRGHQRHGRGADASLGSDDGGHAAEPTRAEIGARARLILDRLRPCQHWLETSAQLLQGQRKSEYRARSRIHGGGENLGGPTAAEQDHRDERIGTGDVLHDCQCGDV